MAELSARQTGIIRLAILSPSQAIRAGLRSMLASGADFTFVGESATLAGFEIPAADCDVIVSTFVPSPVDLERVFPKVEVFPAFLLLSDDLQEATRLTKLPLHAWGVLPMDASTEEMIAAVHALYEGLIVGAPHLMQTLIQASAPQKEGFPSDVYPFQPSAMPTTASDYLTPRETEVLQLLAQGLANKQIAAALKISDHTVKFHISSIYSKLGVGNRTEAVRAGVRRGLILL